MQRSNYPKTKGLAFSALFATLLSISSLISIPIPFSPVPITLQVMVVFLIASLLGPVYGMFSCIIYLFLGMIGIPVFAGATSGIPILLGPTGGYLIGFPLAALAGGTVTSRLSITRKKDLFRVSVATALALVVIYAMGVVWLAEYLHLTLFQGILYGAVPFVAVDIAKAVIVIPVIMRIRWQRLGLPVNIIR